jgi:RHS repeat-associated protein
MPSWDRNSFDRSANADKKNNGYDAASSGGAGSNSPDMQRSALGSTAASVNSTASGNPTQPIPSLQLPKGGGAIRGIDEKFHVNAANGTSSCSIPLPFSPSRMSFVPELGLGYSSGNGNGPFGLGWQLSVPSIVRRTRNCLPKYEDVDESDIFQLSGSEDLVPVLIKGATGWTRQPETRTVGGINYSIMAYRPRIEQGFSRIERWTDTATAQTHWRILSATNSCSYFGLTTQSRLSDPQDPNHVFEWLLCQTQDDKGNIALFNYKTEDRANIPLSLSEKNRSGSCTQVYLSSVWYGNAKPFYSGDPVPGEDQFLFRAVFDYGEHDPSAPIPANIYLETRPWACRKDPFSSFRSGFDIRTYRRCSRVLMFHCFPNRELPVNPCLVSSLVLQYDDDLSLLGNGDQVSGFSFLVRATQNGHIWDPVANSYTTRSLPDLDFQYQQHEWNTMVLDLTAANLAGSPVGVDNNTYQWVDLFSEGISGILTEQSDAWYYKSNLGGGSFTPAMPLGPIPSFRGLAGGDLAIRDLEGDGVKYLVQESVAPQGFFRLGSGSDGSQGDWNALRFFDIYPTIDPRDPNARRLDLNEDGRADILYAEDNQFRWYESLGAKGFRIGGTIPRSFDEEKGPAIVFADAGQSIFLADMSGDGLADIVRIRNGEVCYWPNLGYGRFGAKVSMDNAPLFDTNDGFNPGLLRLADIDGSGTTDLVYLGRNDFRVWMNLSGNAWSAAPEIISPFPAADDATNIDVLDFLGTGTASIVCSSPFSKQPLRYIDLMGSKKPGLLIAYQNNCGKETGFAYTSSTSFYMADKRAGIPWITKLPFPVQCVSKVTTADRVRETIFTNTYSYRHGFYDPYDKEFRGFARVEQFDTESFEQFILNSAKNVVEQDLYQPPVRSVSWFHTGAFLGDQELTSLLGNEYFQNTIFAEYAMPAPLLPAGMDADDIHEAFRACKSLSLRSETYSNDGSALQDLPYSASQSNASVIMLQPKGPNRYATFLVVPSESISYAYERDPADPRITQSFVLSTDQYGNVLRAAAVIHPRVARPTGALAIPDTVWTQQNQLYISTEETDYTNDVIQPDVYRLRVSYEARTYDLAGIPQPVTFYFSKTGLDTAIAGAAAILYEQDFSGAPEKRLIRQGRKILAKDDLSGPLPLGSLASLGISYRQYSLAYTAGLVTKYFGTKVTDAMLSAAMYVHSEGDADWWTQSGLTLYSATPASDFYIPAGAQDVFGNTSTVQYDPYFQLVVSTIDAISNSTVAVNDYRTLLPMMLTDPNLNRSAVLTDELRMPIAIAVMGKAGGSDGDTLADPTVKLEYDFLNWQNNGKPNYGHALAREVHGPANKGWIESYIYSDGSGAVIMTKNQAAPGMAASWNPVTQHADQVFADPRWIGTGRTILNNKGKTVKQYQPYFSATSGYETEDELVQTGSTAILYYDPPGRNIRTDLPDGTFAKVAFDGWYNKTYDSNDTVRDSNWYLALGSPDPTGPEPPGADERAAWLAAKDFETPTVRHTDSLGRSFYTVADYGGGVTAANYSFSDLAGRYTYEYDQLNREVARSYTNLLGQSFYTISAEKGEHWAFSDVIDRVVSIWDNDISVFSSSYDQLNRPLSVYLLQAGTKTVISHAVYGDLFPVATGQAMNLRGKLYQLYDQAGVMVSATVDFKSNTLVAQRQLCGDYRHAIDWTPLDGLIDIPSIQAAAAPLLEREIFTSSVALDALNRPVTVGLPDGSEIVPQYDAGSGLVSMSANIMGAAVATTFLADQEYNAKGQRLNVRYGNDVSIRYTYDPVTFRLQNITTLQHPADPAGQAIQDLNYHYDPVGNITEINDTAQQTWFFRNSVVLPANSFTYDALYQLISATGREHAGLGMDMQRDNNDIPFLQPVPENNNAGAVRNYTENYTYDTCGNLLSLQHLAAGATWTQRYQYQYQVNPADKTNRLSATSLPGDAPGVFSGLYAYGGGQDHGLHGNMTAMPHLSSAGSMAWDFMDRLSSVNLGGGGTAYYTYGLGGGRARKVIERQGGKILERIYLGAVEIYRERQGVAAPTLERYTLHIADNSGRFARVDTKTIDTNNSDPGNALDAPAIRYQYANHLGSAMLETDGNGNIVSYEEYHPFGTSSYRVCQTADDLSLKRYRFSGKERDDETGFYYFGARYYAAWLGRWTSSDPAGFVDGFNLYKYCSNNPVMFHDPNGMEDKDFRMPIFDMETGREIGYIGGPNGTPHYYPAPTPQSSSSKPKAAGPKPTAKHPSTPSHSHAPAAASPSAHTDAPAAPANPPPPTAPPPPPPPAPASEGKAPTGSSGVEKVGKEGSGVGGPASLAGPGTEKFIWNYYDPMMRGKKLEQLYGVPKNSNTKNWDLNKPTKVQQVKSTDAFDTAGDFTRKATRDAAQAIQDNPGTMAGKNPQAVMITPTDSPRSAGRDIEDALTAGHGRKIPTGALPPEHVRGLPGAVGAIGKGLTVIGTGLSAFSLGYDLASGDYSMAAGDALSTVGGGLEIYALTTAGATVAGFSAVTVGLAVGGIGIAVTSAISGYRAYERGDTAGVVAGAVGTGAGLAIAAGAIGIIAGVAGAPILLGVGLVLAAGVGVYHLGKLFDLW